MNNITYNPLKAAFPNVIYWGYESGRVNPEPTSSEVLISSDNSELRFDDELPQAYIDAEYLINIPVFKKHHRAGISLGTKNHFGSIGAYAGGAWHMHYSLPCPEADGIVTQGDYGAYRCFVDIMGHAELGGKTILHLVDGIWGSTNWGHPPIKWRMTPFNNDWPSSLFLSQDPVAIESVGYDFLFNEFDESHPTEGLPATDDKGPYPRFEGTDDYLHQAADPANWPAGISYDPENDGSALTSLGTHEHWNNPIDKKYSRNLGTGNGIELYYTSTNPAGLDDLQLASSPKVYPNPVTEKATIQFNLAEPALVFLELYSPEGKLVQTLNQGQLKAGQHQFSWSPDGKPGLYIGRLSVTSGEEHRNHAFKIRVQ